MKKKAKKAEPFETRLIFDSKDSANGFVAHWLDGGGDGGGNIDWDTCYEESDKANWGKGSGVPAFLRIKGSGDFYDEK